MEIERITKEGLKKKMESGAPLTLIDVRNPVDYGKSKVKIKGAVRMTLDEVEARRVEFDPGIEVVAYCT